MPETVEITGTQCRIGREMLRMSQRILAEQAGLSHRSVTGFENGGDLSAVYRKRLRSVLAERGVAFLDREGVCRA